MRGNMLTSVRALTLPFQEQVQALVSELLDRSGCVCSDRAARRGWLHCFEWTQPTGVCACHARNGNNVMGLAAASGHLEVVQWLHTNCREGYTTYAMNWAAKYGHLEVVQWLHANLSEGCTAVAMDTATANGCMEVMEWLHANRSEGCTTSAMDSAAKYGHLAVVEWLHANCSESCTTRVVDSEDYAAHLEVVQLQLQEEKALEIDVDASRALGSVEVADWMLMAS